LLVSGAGAGTVRNGKAHCRSSLPQGTWTKSETHSQRIPSLFTGCFLVERAESRKKLL
jgi:hypothetical protein